LLKHNDLIGRKAFVDPSTGLLWAVLPGGALEQVTYPNGVTPAYRNLIGASLMLYTANFGVANGLSAIAEWAEESGNDAIVSSVLTFEANLNLARRVAIEGLENVVLSQKRR
jgi:hypothetical protein